MYMKVTDEAYQNHAVFVDLERYGSFYESLATSVFGFVSLGTKAVCNIDSFCCDSSLGDWASLCVGEVATYCPPYSCP